jgi:predicted RNase H-like HicB family nuclease
MKKRKSRKRPSVVAETANVSYNTSRMKPHSAKTYTAVVERCPETGLYVGYVPGFPGAHSQGATLDELNRNLKEVVEMLLEEGEPKLEAEFVGVQNVVVGHEQTPRS